MEGSGERVLQLSSPNGKRTVASLRSRMDRLPLFATFWAFKAHVLELFLIAGAYAVYLLSRGLIFSDLESVGLANAGRVISVEESLGIFWEPVWQSWILDHADALALFLNWVYIITYWPIIVVVGLVLYFVNRPRYYYYRSVVVISLAFALLIFMLFPVTSPFNINTHFVDTIQTLGPSMYGSPDMAFFYNTTAAMPSLHFSWTLVLGILFVRSLKGWFRLVGILYPAMTFFAITVTGNHFILDAAAGGALVVVAFAVMELGFRRGLFRWDGKWAGQRGLPGRRGILSPETWPRSSTRQVVMFWRRETARRRAASR